MVLIKKLRNVVSQRAQRNEHKVTQRKLVLIRKLNNTSFPIRGLGRRARKNILTLSSPRSLRPQRRIW